MTRRILPAAIVALVFLGVAALYVTGQAAAYEAALRGWGVDPFRFPFLDTDTWLSALRCLNAGVDVFAGNPCDPIRRTFDYSPLWLLLAKLPVTETWLVPAGLTVDIAFIASLLLLPPGRGRVETFLIVLGVCSSAVVFGLERGNNDLVLFVLAVIAAALVCRTPGLRVAGYSAALLAGLLKYYPMTLLAMITRERPLRFFGIVAACLAVVAVFLLTLGDELTRALHLIPRGGWFGDMFGSSTLPGGLTRHYGWPEETAGALRIVLTVAALAVGATLAFRPKVGAAFDHLTEWERTALLAGGLLILSCFFTAQNIGYRALHLVLTLPALTALYRLRAGRLWSVTTFTVLAVLWAQGWRNWFASQDLGRSIFIGGWMVREALWWWAMTVMIAVVLGLLVRSEMGRWVLRRT